MQIGNGPRAATHAEALLTRFGDDAAAVALANEILTELRPKLTRYEVACATACTLSIDGRLWSVESRTAHVLYLEPGSYSFEASYEDGRTRKRSQSGQAGERVALELGAPAALPTKARPSPNNPTNAEPARVADAPPEPASRGMSPAIPITVGVLTLAVAGGATWASLDTVKQHDKYVESPSEQGWNDGTSRQRLANVLWGSTAVLATTTVALAWFTDWGGKREVALRSGVTPGGASFAVVGKF
jgi:hypothetical protein